MSAATQDKRPAAHNWTKHMPVISAGLATPTLMMLMAVGATILSPVMHLLIRHAGSAELLGVSEQQAVKWSDQTVADLMTGGPFGLVQADGSPLYTANEVNHLQDVRHLLGVLAALSIIAVIVLVLAFAPGEDRRKAWRGVYVSTLTVAVLILSVALIGLIAFRPAYHMFHLVFFEGNTVFDPASSHLVQLYPTATFWQPYSLLLGGLLLAMSVGFNRIAKRQMH